MHVRKLFRWQAFTTAFTVAAVAYAWRSRQSHGTFLRVPFDFRVPTPQRVRERWWNSEDSRILTPHVFGVGWSINLLQLVRRVRREEEEPREAEGIQEHEG